MNTSLGCSHPSRPPTRVKHAIYLSVSPHEAIATAAERDEHTKSFVFPRTILAAGW